jgi:oligoribonuclease NrnB/cAMP/cGMP phosphodiesterase (DHH superfamily)
VEQLLTERGYEMKPLVIYHANCADGFGAAFAAWLKFGDEAEYLPFQYGTEAQLNILALRSSLENREVYILDFSFERPTMNTLFSCAQKVVWLDHHKTAFEMWCGEYTCGMRFSGDTVVTSNPAVCHYICLDNNRSGALIAWEYFHPEKEVPMLIKHIDDYDRWQFKLEGTKEFNKALWSYAPWSFEQWESILGWGQVEVERLKEEGAAILRAHEQNVQTTVKGAARACCIEKPLNNKDYVEFRAEGLAANCPPHLSSDVGHQLANQSETYGLLWYINKEGKCLCSLRSNGDYDVSAIAKVFGGGGHKNAAGFETDIQTLLEWIND